MTRRRELLAALAAAVLGAGAGPARADSYHDWFLYIQLDRAESVRALLRAGFDVNALSERGQSGLLLALREGSLDTARVLLEAPGLAADAANSAGETPLMMAALKGHLPIMAELIARGAAVNREGWTPLHYAASGGHEDAIELLLSRGAALNAQAPNGATPLMMAAGFGTIDSARLLLRRGADPTLRNQGRRSAADYARMAGRDGLARDLQAAAEAAAPDIR